MNAHTKAAEFTTESVDESNSRHVRSIFLSDIHLGSGGCKAEALLGFLRDYDSDYLFLVGDIIDGWQLKSRWYWPQAHNDVIQKILRKVRKGTRVRYIAGNHDSFVRKFIGLTFGGIEVLEDYVHLTADGKRLWLTHGDYFDGVVQHSRWITHIGDVAYESVLVVNSHLNRLRARVGLPYWSLSSYLKYKVKTAVQFIATFEEAVAKEAKKRGMDAVLCGHIHHAAMREIDGVLYLNDGDWVESLTAMVEHHDGRFELVEWQKVRGQVGELVRTIT